VIARLVILIPALCGAPPAGTGDEGPAPQPVTCEQAFADLHRFIGERCPCFGLKGIDWPAVGRELLPKVKLVEDDEAFGILCMELIARLEDSHAHLLAGTAAVPTLPRAGRPKGGNRTPRKRKPRPKAGAWSVSGCRAPQDHCASSARKSAAPTMPWCYRHSVRT